jgi:hypothetical protein
MLSLMHSLSCNHASVCVLYACIRRKSSEERKKRGDHHRTLVNDLLSIIAIRAFVRDTTVPFVLFLYRKRAEESSQFPDNVNIGSSNSRWKTKTSCC